MRIEELTARPFPIPLKEPFTISRASVTSTRAALVRARIVGGLVGYGESALPLGDKQTIEEVVAQVASLGLAGAELDTPEAIGAALEPLPATARAGAASALFDAFAQLAGEPLYRVLGGTSAAPMVTDITLPIADPHHLADLARRYWDEGFRCFKIKVGADLASDKATVQEVAAATPKARLRYDANEGFDADRALDLLRFTAGLGLEVECFEQPCARDDVAGLCRVRAAGVPVVADESVRDASDLDRLHAAGAIDGVNLKLIKMGGVDRCMALGRHARGLGLGIMVGAMIESRLGLTAMAHVAAALGGAEWVDLDTAFLLVGDPYEGGMQSNGPILTLTEAPGLGMRPLDEMR